MSTAATLNAVDAFRVSRQGYARTAPPEEEPWAGTSSSATTSTRASCAPTRDFTTLGSGSIVRQLTQCSAIEELNLVVNPVLLGEGKSAFTGVEPAHLELAEAKTFKSGRVWLTYLRP